jgi:hypothetical protein
MKHLREEINRLSTQSMLQERIKWIFEQLADKVEKLEGHTLGGQDNVAKEQIRPDPALAKVEEKAKTDPADHENRAQGMGKTHVENYGPGDEETPAHVEPTKPAQEPDKDMFDFLDKNKEE